MRSRNPGSAVDRLPAQPGPQTRVAPQDGPGHGASTPAGALIGLREVRPNDRSYESPAQEASPSEDQARPSSPRERSPFMTVIMDATAPWSAVELDPARILPELRARFPWAVCWYGEFTGGWWALVRDHTGRDRLLEGRTPAELGHHLNASRSRPTPPRAPQLARPATSHLVPAETRTRPHERQTPPPHNPTPPGLYRLDPPRGGGDHSLQGERGRGLGHWVRRQIGRHAELPSPCTSMQDSTCRQSRLGVLPGPELR